MRKLDFNYDEKLVNEYIAKIQKKLPSYEVNIDNVNDFDLLIKERECCMVCKGLDECGNHERGYFTEYEDGKFVIKECKFKREDKLKNNKESLIKTLYLPKTVLQARLSNFDTNCESRRKIYALVNDFILKYKAHEKCKGLYLFGEFSIGKTYALACIANELSLNNISSLLIYFPDLVVDLKNAMGNNRFEGIINMLKSVDVLMLDDLGSENMTPWLRDDILGPIVNYRVLEGKPIFISSNIKPNQLRDHLSIDQTPSNKLKGARVASRLNSLMAAISMDDSNKYDR